MNCYTMALPQQRPQPNPLFAVSCGPRAVFSAASVHECIDDDQTLAYPSPKRVKLENEHSRSYPSSPPEATSPPGFNRDFDSCGECNSPASRKMQGHGETWKNLPIKPHVYNTKSNANNNNNFNANNNNNNNNNKNNFTSIPQARIPEDLSSEGIHIKTDETMRHHDRNSPIDFLTKRESDCSSPGNSESTNFRGKRNEEQRDFKVDFKMDNASCDSSSIHDNHRLIPDLSSIGNSDLSSPSPRSSHSTISVLPVKSSPQPAPSSFPSPSLSSGLPSSLSVPSSSSSSAPMPSSLPELKQEEKPEDCRLSECSDKNCTDLETLDDGRTSRLSCIVDIETDTPPTSPVTSLSPSHSPLNLSKSCLESSGSDVDHRRETPSRSSDPGRHNAERTVENAPYYAQNQHFDVTGERQNEDEDTGKPQKTNFSIDAILSSNFGAANPSTDLFSSKNKDEKTNNGCHSPLDSSNDRVYPSSVIHSKNSAFSAVDLSVKVSHSNASLSPSSNLSSTPPSPKSISSPHARSPNDSYGNASVTEDENFAKSTNLNHMRHYPYPYGHLLKTSQGPPPPRDSTRSFEEVFSESKNNINTNGIHPFQRFFPSMFPSPFPIPKHGAPAPGPAEMEDFFHRNFPFLNQAYSHLVGKFPFAYMPTEQNFPLHSISKMHPDQNPLFDPNRVLNMPHNNAILHNRSPGLSGNNPRLHPNFPNPNDLTENINPKLNHRSLIDSPFNKNDCSANKNCNNKNNSPGESLKISRLHPSMLQPPSNESRGNTGTLLPPSPKVQMMDSKLSMLRSKSTEATLQKPLSDKSPKFLDVKADKTVEVKGGCDVVGNSKSARKNSSDNQKGTDKATSDDATKDADTLWPAWVFCTRYSDRPSSGPRSRKPKRKASVDEKRPRTAFTNDQLQRLKREFEDCRYLTETRRRNLATELGLSESQIKIWFQNKRAKIKKSLGVKNTLALKLMEEGLYNHSTVKMHEDSN